MVKVSADIGILAKSLYGVSQAALQARRLGDDGPWFAHPRPKAREDGFVGGQNVAFENALGQLDRLPELAADLVKQRVNVILTAGLIGTAAAKAATSTISIVLFMGEDPVRHGFVESLNGRAEMLPATPISPTN